MSDAHAVAEKVFIAVKVGPGRKIEKLAFSTKLAKVVGMAELYVSTSKEKYVPNTRHPERTAWMSATTSVNIMLDSSLRGGVLGHITYGQAARLHGTPDPAVVSAALHEGLKNYSPELSVKEKQCII